MIKLGGKWLEEELEIINKYATTARSAYWIYIDLLNAGHKRTFKAVKMKITDLGLLKPKRFIRGREMRIGYFDIESSGLVGDFSIMLSWSIKERDVDKVHHDVITKEDILSGNEDRRIIESLREALNKFDVIITYYGTRFDVPYTRTRMEYHDIQFPHFESLKHIDCYYIMRYRFKIHSNRLDSATEFFGIGGKTRLKPSVWNKAKYGDHKALKYILKHNVADVKILERLHKRVERYVKPLVRAI